jgi:RHH-type proline utilization regulon transcriptional repressor/proline dehydrogenase/delta 1-pyrroline-5-carboxylate dehydrogenase
VDRPIDAAGVRTLLAAARDELSATDLAFVTRAARSDAAAWERSFGHAADVSGLTAERNVLRYLPHPVTVRLTGDGSVAALVRVVAAGTLAGAPMRISVASALPAPVAAALGQIVVEDDATFAAGLSAGRVRLIGGSAADLAVATGGRPDVAVWAGPVTEAGRVELLVFVREQAVSITAHRFGNPDPLAAEVL